ncbi:MAG: hypothetical protein ACI90V_010029, partial [Bacillariaceae sp.]|jgi:hypothetical protein
VRDDESTGVEVETVEEEEEVPNGQTKGVPTRNTTTRTSRRVKQSTNIIRRTNLIEKEKNG